MRRVLLSVVVSAFAGVAASIASCGAAFADGAQGQNAPAETRAYVRKVMGGNTATQPNGSNVIDAAQAAQLLGLSPANRGETPQHQSSSSNIATASEAEQLLGLPVASSPQKSPSPTHRKPSAPSASEKADYITDPNELLRLAGVSGVSKPSPATDIPQVPGYTLTPVDYNPFAWYRQPVSGGLQKIAAWLLLGVSVLMLFMMTRMRWFNQRHVGWNRLIVALTGLWLSAVGGVLILIGGVPIEEWAGIVYVPVIGFLVLYKLTAWVISGFAK